MKKLIRNKQEVKQMLFKTSTFIALGIVIFLFSGCATVTVTPIPSDYMKDITQGKLITPGCKIESVTGDFIINSGEVFTSPFQCNTLEYEQGFLYSTLIDRDVASPQGQLYINYAIDNNTVPISEIEESAFLNGEVQFYIKLPIIKKYNIALKLGAQKVLVTIPDSDKKLFGVLLLSRVYKTATGPQSRSYQIEIPDSYIDAAKGGKISVIHETVNFTYIYEDTEVPGNTYTWVLWLSDVPFGG